MTYLAGVGIDRRSVIVSIQRKATGAYVSGGDWVASGVPATGDIKATVQPVSGRQVMNLPEGIREEARYLVWSRSTLAMEDVIVWLNTSLRLIYVWPRPEGGFYRAAAGLIA